MWNVSLNLDVMRSMGLEFCVSGKLGLHFSRRFSSLQGSTRLDL